MLTILDFLAVRQPDILLALAALGLLTRAAVQAAGVETECVDWEVLMAHDRWRRVGRRLRQVGRRT